MVKGLFVATLTRQGIVDVSQGHNLCGDGDLIPFQTVRVAAAVPALMVPAADGIGHLDQLRLLLEGQLVQNIRTDGGVGFHRLKFFLRQLAGLVQNRLRNADFADVMQRGGRADEENIRRGQAVFVGFLHQCAQQNVGGGLDVQHVQAAFSVAELHNMAQNVNHRGAAFFFFVDLLGHQTHQPLLLGVQHQRVDDAAAHHGHIKGAADIIGSAQIIGTLHKAGRILGRNHNDRDFVNPVVFVHHGQHVKAVHVGHHDIQQKQVDTGVCLQNGHSLTAVLGFQNLIAVAQHLCQDGAVHGGIVRNQDSFFFAHSFTCCSPKRENVQKRSFP